MTIETLKAANELAGKIDLLRTRLNGINQMIVSAQDVTSIQTRVRGLDIELPKAVFRNQVMTQKTALESELSALQAEFNAL